MTRYKSDDPDAKPLRYLDELPVELAEIPIAEINRAGRMREDLGNITELRQSIKQEGLIQPISVMRYEEPFEGKYNYYLLAGERRITACMELKKETISARIYPHGLNGYEIRQIELMENVRRKDMNDFERLKAINAIHDLWQTIYGEPEGRGLHKKGHSIKDTAKRLGLSIGTVHGATEVAEFAEAIPKLRNVENISEAKKIIKKAKRQVEVQQAIDNYDKEMEGKEDKELKDLYVKSYIFGDFFERAKDIPEGTIDLVDLDIDFPIEEDDNIQHLQKQDDQKDGTYLEVTKEEFEGVMKATLEECYRIMKKDSWIIIWFGYEYFKEIQTWAKAIGFKTSFYHGKWYKGVSFAHTQNPYHILGHTTEPFFYFKKGSPEISEPHPDTFEFPPVIPSKKTHPHEKPIDLMSAILQVLINPGSHIVVPFAGSGNTLIAGFKYKCRCVGFDLSEKYKKEYIVKIKETTF